MKATHFRVRVGLVLLVCCAFIIVVQQARASIVLDFANLVGTSVNFAGGSFSFSSNINGYQFVITGVSGGVGDSVGLDGYVQPGGPFTIGTISGSDGFETAPVTGSGMLYITDAQSKNLMGTIQWVDITSIGGGGGSGGVLNLNGTINLTGLSYPGYNNDLGALSAANSAIDVVTFQFIPGETLAQLKATAGLSTSYSGNITAVPEPPTMIAGALLLLPFAASTLRILRKRQTV
jgi:hypothetical protein